jgi:hypothetical protein
MRQARSSNLTPDQEGELVQQLLDSINNQPANANADEVREVADDDLTAMGDDTDNFASVNSDQSGSPFSDNVTDPPVMEKLDERTDAFPDDNQNNKDRDVIKETSLKPNLLEQYEQRPSENPFSDYGDKAPIMESEKALDDTNALPNDQTGIEDEIRKSNDDTASISSAIDVAELIRDEAKEPSDSDWSEKEVVFPERASEQPATPGSARDLLENRFPHPKFHETKILEDATIEEPGAVEDPDEYVNPARSSGTKQKVQQSWSPDKRFYPITKGSPELITIEQTMIELGNVNLRHVEPSPSRFPLPNEGVSDDRKLSVLELIKTFESFSK